MLIATRVSSRSFLLAYPGTIDGLDRSVARAHYGYFSTYKLMTWPGAYSTPTETWGSTEKHRGLTLMADC